MKETHSITAHSCNCFINFVSSDNSCQIRDRERQKDIQTETKRYRQAERERDTHTQTKTEGEYYIKPFHFHQSNSFSVFLSKSNWMHKGAKLCMLLIYLLKLNFPEVDHDNDAIARTTSHQMVWKNVSQNSVSYLSGIEHLHP